MNGPKGGDDIVALLSVCGYSISGSVAD